MTDVLDATLAATLWPTRRSLRLARNAALAVGGALALALSAKIQVPFTPVPMTLQTLVVLALGAAYGARLAAATNWLRAGGDRTGRFGMQLEVAHSRRRYGILMRTLDLTRRANAST